MSRYEMMYIIDPTLEDAPRKELVEKFSAMVVDNGGTIEKLDEWGKRRLAYTIDYKTEGYYVLVIFSAGPEVPKEMERNLQISESILRYLIVKLEQKQTSVKPRSTPVRPVPMAAPVAQVAAVAVEVEVVEVEVIETPAVAAEAVQSVE